MTRRLRAPERGVTVRMMRMGFGDCFLLAFRGDDEEPVYLLVDSGTHFRAEGATARMRDVAQHVRDATGGRIHVLVGTHEHFDHLAGFNRGRDTWDGIRVDETWVAWTEEPGNELADRLRRGLTSLALGVGQALTRWSASLQALEDQGGADGAPLGLERDHVSAVRRLLEFSDVEGGEGSEVAAGAGDGDDDGPLEAAADVPRRTLADAYRWMELKASEKVRYLRPADEPFMLPGVSGVRVYVLGPPEDEALLLRSDPTPGPDSEVYDLTLGMSPDAAFLAAARHGGTPLEELDEEERRAVELSCPFEPRFRVPLDEADAAEGDLGALAAGYRQEEAAWRRIDHDWLRTAGELALKLDEDTNNTSLVLAFELVESGRVLLFVADAQVGNWLSWAEKRWESVGEDCRPVEMVDLLRRTALYKVGHHGSHNATLRELGLERMTSPELVAMIPTDEDFSATMDWNIPFPPLVERLKAKARGRVLRADRTRAPRKPAEVGEAEWQRFKDALTVGRDYIEYTVE